MHTAEPEISKRKRGPLLAFRRLLTIIGLDWAVFYVPANTV